MASADDKLDNLRKKLYSSDQPAADHREGSLSEPEETDSPEDWQHGHDQGGSGMNLLDKILLFAGGFLLLAIGFAGVMIGLDGSGVSPQDVKISISGPNTINAGDTVTFGVAVTNNNSVTLKNPTLTISFPADTRAPDDSGRQLRRKRFQLETLKPQQTVQRQVTATMFGQQGADKQVDVSLDYEVKGSNAIFTKESRQVVAIGELPIKMRIDGPGTTTPGQRVTFSLEVNSNSTKAIQDLLVVADYPFGFSVQQADPAPVFEDTVWSLGTLKPAASRTIELTGTFEDNVKAGQRTFSFAAGIASRTGSSTIGTQLSQQQETLAVRQPLIDLAVGVAGATSSTYHVSGPDESVSGFVRFANNTQSTLSDGEIRVQLQGESVVADSVEVDRGLYREDTQTIVWNSQTNPSLLEFEPGTQERFSFTFQTESAETLAQYSNPTVTLSSRMQATAPATADLPTELTANNQQTIRLGSAVDIIADTLYTDGPFANSGPVPPVVGEVTEYTLRLSARNSSNEITDARLEATLPANVEIAGQPQAAIGTVSVDRSSGRIEWRIGRLPAGVGYTEDATIAHIPVRIRPTAQQVGTAPTLLKNLRLTGEDSFTGREIEITDITAPTTQRDDTDDDTRGEVRSTGS